MKSAISVLKYLIVLALGIGLFMWVFKDTKWSEVEEQIRQMNPAYIVLALLTAVISHWSRAARWSLLIKPLGHKVSHFNGFVAVMIGYLANLAVPRMGEVSRCVVLRRTDNVPVDKLIGTVVVERVMDMISLLVIVGLTLLLEFGRLSEFIAGLFRQKFSQGANADATPGMGVSNIILALVIFAVLVGAGIFAFRRFRHSPAFAKIMTTVRGFVDGMKTIRQIENGWAFLFWTVTMWLMYYLQVYICLLAMPATQHLGAITALSILAMGTFGFVAPVQGGLGAYHGIVAQTLEMVYGTTALVAKAFAFVAWAFQNIVVVVVGALSLVYLAVFHRKKESDDTSSADTAEALS